jgi:hypothetical protein
MKRYKTSIALAITFTLGVTAVPAVAQQASTDEDDAPVKPQSEVVAAQKPAKTTPVEPTAAPEDYRASEQISEDLSVSFPVDI